jgi:hypothetical protein
MILFLALACKTSDVTPPEALDLTAVPAAGTARGGQVTDASALFGGIDAEGQVGDYKLHNAVARFIIQGDRIGSYYLTEAGGVIDADAQREPGEPGADVVDEWFQVLGAGITIAPVSFEVVSDGTDGGPAVLRAVGEEVALGILEGAVEQPGFLRPFGVTVVTTYTLPPDSPLLEVRTEVTAADAVTVQLGDAIIGAPEGAWRYSTGGGFDSPGLSAHDQVGYLGQHGEVAIALLSGSTSGDGAPGGEAPLEAGATALLSAVTDLMGGFAPSVALPAGGTFTYTRSYGAARTLAALTDAALARQGDAGQEVSGTVTADDGPVPGALVHVLADGAPWTVAVTGADGTFRARAPTGVEASARAVGRGGGRFLDLPRGAAHYGPYAGAANDAALQTWSGDDRPTLPEGRGVASASDPLRLGLPAYVEVVASDALPFVTWVSCPELAPDPRLTPPRSGGRSAAGWARDGAVTLAVEPPAEGADCTLVAHRGMRFEAFTAPVTLTAGQVERVEVDLTAAYTHPGWLLGDPHSHAAPSGDAYLPMEDRLIVQAANGVQVHFGTDHDHVADYRPLLGPLGLTPHLTSIVADEVSPPLRGHFNIYPVEPVVGAPNQGAFRWWSEIPTSTDAMLDRLRELHGDDILVQSNHPTDSGMASSARWEVGEVGDPNKWTTKIQAAELLNNTSKDDYQPFYFDMITRGVPLTPTGVSDGHAWLDGHVGMSGTFFAAGVDVPADLTPAALVDAWRRHATVVARGVFLDLSVEPGATLAPGATIDVTARSPSWIVVDRLLLYQNGAIVDEIEGTTGTFTLDTDADAVFVIAAEGDRSMRPVSDATPWAMTAPWWVDAEGDGWNPPFGPWIFD